MPRNVIISKQSRRTAELLWRLELQPRRGPKPTLAVEQIVKAAIAIADRDGLAALSMERVARLVKCSPMALYRYLPGKAELVALMVDVGLGAPPPEIDEGGGWRERLLRWTEALATVFREHPWSLAATNRLRLMGPCELAWLEAGLRAFAGTELTPRERESACLMLLAHVRTSAQFTASSTGADALSGAAWESATLSVIGRQAEAYPELRALLASSPSGKKPAPDFGLTCLLDGIELRIAARGSRSRRRAHTAPR